MANENLDNWKFLKQLNILNGQRDSWIRDPENETEQCCQKPTQNNKKLKKAELKDRGCIGGTQHHI